jgi:ribosomal-protein-alanine N-acetyltransferase
MDESTLEPLHFRPMLQRDMSEVLGIENCSFEFRWCKEDFVRQSRRRNSFALVVDYDFQRVVGFMVYEVYPKRLHVVNFAVHPRYRRRGVGAGMVRELSGRLSPNRRNRISLHVRDSNLDAQLFFRAVGFRAIDVIRDFYDETTEDAYLMEYRFTRKALCYEEAEQVTS